MEGKTKEASKVRNSSIEKFQVNKRYREKHVEEWIIILKRQTVYLNVTLRLVRVATAAVEEQYYIL